MQRLSCQPVIVAGGPPLIVLVSIEVARSRGSGSGAVLVLAKPMALLVAGPNGARAISMDAEPLDVSTLERELPEFSVALQEMIGRFDQDLAGG